MTRTTLLIGPPGTGKTTSLLNEVDTLLKNKGSAKRIAYLSFTKKAAQEAVTRASEQFDLSKDDFPYFRTLHSLAFQQLGLSHTQVMGTEHYTAFGNALGTPFLHDYDQDIERCPLGGALGDRCLQVYALARARQISLEEQWWQSDAVDLPFGVVKKFAVNLEAYKKAYDILDFTDFLDDCQAELDVDLFIIDEAQDLTRQQWAFARRLGARAPKVLIAGDDDQAIFQWAGADLRSLLALQGIKRVLPLSYRLPRKVFEFACKLSARIRQRFIKAWRPRDAEGAVDWVSDPDKVRLLDDQTWMLLTRHRYQGDLFEAVARDQGVVYMRDGVWSNQTPAARAVLTYEALRRGKTLPAKDVKAMSRYISNLVVTGQDQVTYENVAWPFGDRRDWLTALDLVGGDERQYIRALRRNGESLTSPGRITISTIHGVKGGQADNVVLLPDITPRVQEADVSSEARVWYVGASRARHNLFLVQPQTALYYDLVS